ncbi:MAG TPA: hypothetical protein VGV89_08680 [Thermoplasmata archaeon]|nr:hypothetical protein [Thermoplasmata archaeon]
MGWGDAHRLAEVAYRELGFQAIYAPRQGNLLPPKESKDLVPTASRRVLQSKILVAALLAVMALGAGAALGPNVQQFLGPSAPPGIYQAAVVGGVLLLQLSLLWTTGLQILPVFLRSRLLPVLELLPVPPQDLDRAALLLFLRLFDLPVLAILVVTPIAIGAALGSPLAGLAVVPGALAAVLLALGLALATGEFFVRRVEGSPTSTAATVLRWAFLVLWAIPAFAIYAFISFSPEMLRSLTSLAANDSGGLTVVLAIFPFPYAFLPVLAARGLSGAGLGLGWSGVAVVLLAAAAYAAPLGALGRWLWHAPHRLALALPEHRTVGHGAPVRIRTRIPALALALKDLRVASRSPGYAFIVLLPLLDAAVIGLSTFVGTPTAASVFSFGAAAVSTAALLATFFGPAFFATEVMGYSYARTLPLSNRSLLAGKVGLVVLVYALAAAIVLGFTLTRVFAPWVFLAFVLAEAPALLAAALLEFGVLFRVSAKRGLAITNLYTGAWWATIVVIPGLVVAAAPLVTFGVLGGGLGALGIMGAVALLELALVGPIALRWTGTRSP